MKMKFEEKSVWDIIERTDMMAPFSGKRGIIDNSKKLLDIMLPFLDLKKAKEYNVKLSSPLRIGKIPTMMNDLLRLSRDPILNWHFDKDPDDFVINVKCMHGVYSSEHYLMPLYWLPKMAKRNKKLHDIIVNCIQYAQDRTGVWVLDEDSGGWPYEIVSEGKIYLDDESSTLVNKELIIQQKDEQLDLYDKYFEKYIGLLNRPPLRIQTIRKKIAQFTPMHEFGKWILDWCEDLLKASEHCKLTFQDLHNHAFAVFCEDNEVDPEDAEYDCPPISMQNWVQFCWFDDTDHRTNVEQYIQQAGGECGLLEPYRDYPCRSKADVDDAIANFRKVFGDTPDLIAAVIKSGTAKIDMIEHYLRGDLVTAFYDEKYRREPIRSAQNH